MPTLLSLALCLWPLAGRAGPFDRALEAMARGDLGRARAALDELIGPNQPLAAQAELLEARALFLAGELSGAEAAYQKVLRTARPTTPWGLQARFGLAECLARQGRFERAEALFAEALGTLGAPAHRRELARRFLRLADEALEPAGGRRQPDPGRAEQLYRAALELLEPGDALAERAALAVGRCLSAQKRHAEAARWYEQLLEAEPPGGSGPADRPVLPRLAGSARAAQVRLLAAEDLIAAADRRGARRQLRDLLAAHPRSPWAADAAFLLSRTYGMPHPATGTDLARGQAALRRFLARHPDHPKAAEARLELALAPLGLGRQAEAEDELRALIAAGRDLPADILAQARYQLAVCLAAQARFDEAAAAYRQYLERHPAHKFWSQARAGIEQMHWAPAEAAERDERWAEAGRLFAAFAEQHPAAARAPEALYRAAKDDLEAGRAERALAVLATLTGKFATDPHGWRGLLLTGRIYEEHLGELAKAKEAYDKAAAAGSPVAGQARARLSLLEQPSLLIESPKNFHRGQKPQLTWQVRNVEAVTIRAYRIQAEDFFRDRLAMDSLTDVDIALCEPDRTWTVPVAGYRKLVRIEQRVALPFERPGLYLLNLSAGELEATTAVRISDLGLVVKTGAGEVFGFAQDLVAHKPWAGARILVAAGSRLLAEGDSEADGVFRTALPADVDPERLVVFAVAGDHLAWTGQDHPDTRQPTQLSPRAFVFSERPVYRPGDRVHLSGIYRGVEAGRYAFQAGDELQLTLRDPAGTLLERRPVRLDEYGTFHRALDLDPAAPEGSYRYSLRRGQGPVFSGSFQVREFRRLPFELTVVPDRPVFFRGEPLSGVIQVRHAQGTPAEGLEVQYGLSGEGRVQSGRTDSTGRVRFSFPTRNREETARLTIQARLGRSQQLAEASALLAVAGFDLSLKLDGRALFAGQPFELRLEVTGPDGSPRPARVRLEAVRRVAGAAGGRGERRVWQGQVEVPASGRASATVRLPAAGVHVLRAWASDRAGNPVVAERVVRLRGEKGPGLWLELTDRRQVPGQPARVVIHSRLDRALVLLTAETDRVIEHRSLLVHRGPNPFELPIDAKLAPNFRLAATALDGDRLEQAACSVTVSQRLKIRLRSDKPVYQPGDEVTLTLTASDERGRPVDARLLVAVVDQALLAAYPENLPDLLTSFHVTRPAGAVRTSASNTERFAQVVGRQVEKAEVRQAEGSAAMAALASRRKAMTRAAVDEFDQLAGRESLGLGGLGAVGSGMGAGGLGLRGGGHGVAVHTGKAMIRGGPGAGWRRSFEETAVFLPELRTGPDGVASAVFRLPDTITRWRVSARAVTRDTLLGEAEQELVASRSFWVELVAPPLLEAGDRLAPLARVFNLTGRKVQAELSLWHGEKRQTARLAVPAGQAGDHQFPALAVPAGLVGRALTLRLEARAAEQLDRQQRRLPVRARGVRQQAVAEGRLDHAAARELTLAAGLSAPRLELQLSNRLTRFFLGDRLDPLLFADRPEVPLVALEIRELLGPEADPAMRDLIDQRLRRGLAHLQAVQRRDGGWGFARRAPRSSLELTATALRVLARARPLAAELGWPFPQAAFDKAASWLAAQLPQLAPDDYRARAEVLWALAHLGAARVPTMALQRLHRLRGSLPPGARALLGLTWLRLGRPEQAAEAAAGLGTELARRPVEPEPAGRWWPPRSLSDLDRIRILELLAEVRPADPALPAGRSWLLAHGALLGWHFPRQAAAAFRALNRLQAAGGRERRARVQVRLNGRPAGAIELSGPDAWRSLALDPALIRPGTNRLELELEGGGSLWYRAVLSGYRDDAPGGDPRPAVRIRRHLEPLPADYRGHVIRAGFGVAGPRVEPWFNDVDRLPAGARLQVTLEIERDFDRPLDHCVLLERIPPGFELEPAEGASQATHLLRDGRRLGFYLASAGRLTRVSYRLVAINPGRFRFAPARLISLAYPGNSLLGPASPFEILAPSAPAPQVRPTPLELYQRGLAAAEERDPAGAIAALEALWEGFELRPAVVDEVLGKLLFASIDTADSPRILKYFELAKEKNPALVVPFERIGPVQRAYREQKAYEGGLHLDRGLAEARFVRELKAVGLLESLDEMAEAMDLLKRLLWSYPDNELNARAAYSFSQVIYDRADRLSAGEQLEGFDRPGLLDEVVGFMAGFVGRHPDHPEAPAALFSLASALVERDRPGQAIGWCAVGLDRHPDSALAPALAYLKAFAHFRRGEYGPSLSLCQRVERTARKPGPRDMARYIMAQIHHARGEIDQALGYYRQVAGRFRDAAETIAELEQSWFKAPEVIRAPPGRRAVLELTARNLPELDLRAYRVDLMKLYLLKGSLGDLADVNLAGIRPILSRRVRLRAPRSAGPVEQSVPLALPGAGAYLLLLRGGSRVAPCLVLVGALELEVDELAHQGRVRVAVRDSRGRPRPGARVQLKGDQNERFTAGRTDLRGIFIGDQIEGAVTVIAEQDGAWGLYRGKRMLTGDQAEPEDSATQPRGIDSIDFDDSGVEGQLNNAPAARQLFNQDVKGMSVEQAR